MKKNMYRNIVCLIGFVVFGILAVGSVDTEKDAQETRDTPAIFTVTADQLYREYDENPIAAEAKYKGNVGIISGTIQDIGREITGRAYVILGGAGFLDGVQCTFHASEESAVAEMLKGQHITVKAEVTGKFGHVQAKNASVQ